MRLGVFENFIAEAVFYEIYDGLARNRADARACRRESDDEFAVFTHNTEWPDATVEGFVFRLQDAAAFRVQEGAGNFFFGVTTFVAAKDNLTVAELPHHTVFVRLAEFFNDFGWEQRCFPEALPAEGATELAGGALFFGKDGGKHISQGDPRLRGDDMLHAFCLISFAGSTRVLLCGALRC